MFLLSFIPDEFLIWVINFILLAGLVGIVVTTAFKFFIKYIPSIIPFRTALQVVSLVLLVVGVFFRGGYSVEMSWRERAKEMEEKVAKSEAQAKEANAKIKTVYVDKIKVVKEQQVIIQEQIAQVQEKIDSECKVTPETITILNNSARGIKK